MEEWNLIKLGIEQKILQNFRTSYCDVWDKTGFYLNYLPNDDINSTITPVTTYKTTDRPETTEGKSSTSSSQEFTTDLNENGNSTSLFSLSSSLVLFCLLAISCIHNI